MRQSLSSSYPTRAFVSINAAKGGHNTWSNLVRLTADILNANPNVIVLDHANDSDDNKSKATMEAFIRRVWTESPATKLVIVESPTWITQDTGNNAIVDTPTNTTVITLMRSIAAYYGIPIAAYWEWCKAVVPDDYDLLDLVSDTVHPTQLGYIAMGDTVLPYLPDGGGSRPDTLPTPLYADTILYQNEPTRTVGTGNDAMTGTWTTTATRITSTTAGSTVTFSATCQSFGIYRSDGGVSSGIEVSVNGGAYSDLVQYQNGNPVAAGRGLHSITFRVKTGGTVRIDEFWAI